MAIFGLKKKRKAEQTYFAVFHSALICMAITIPIDLEPKWIKSIVTIRSIQSI